MSGSKVMGHALRRDRKSSGATYTPASLADAVAVRLLDLKPEAAPSAGPIRVLDPAIGDGALLISLLGSLSTVDRARVQITAFDIDEDALIAARDNISTLFPEVALDLRLHDFLDYAVAQRGTGTAFDLIIGNPPYVRVQTLPTIHRDRIRADFDIGGRMDLAFPFILAMRELLAPTGCAAIITSNRILSTNAGAGVRKDLQSSAALLDIWDLGDTKLFDAAVLPCVIYFEHSAARGGQAQDQCGFTTIYEDKALSEPEHVKDICAHVLRAGSKIGPDGRKFDVRRGKLDATAGWRISLTSDEEWIDRLTAATWKKFDDVAKISVGIKTTADKVFIAREWSEPRPELLRPLVTHHVAGRFRPTSLPVCEVLYPHEMKGGRRAPVDLKEYPASKAHLEAHHARLSGRTYVRDSGREWFEIWVPHSPGDWACPKIVFRDIAERPTFWLEAEGSVVNGDCYWVKLGEDQDLDLIWLMLAVANSRLIERFYDVFFNERLYAGRRRFMTRHVRQFPLPDPGLQSSIDAALIALRLACERNLTDQQRTRMEDDIEDLVKAAFGM